MKWMNIGTYVLSMREVEAQRMAMFPVHWDGVSESNRNKGKLWSYGVEGVQRLKFQMRISYMSRKDGEHEPCN